MRARQVVAIQCHSNGRLGALGQHPWWTQEQQLSLQAADGWGEIRSPHHKHTLWWSQYSAKTQGHSGAWSSHLTYLPDVKGAYYIQSLPKSALKDVILQFWGGKQFGGLVSQLSAAFQKDQDFYRAWFFLRLAILNFQNLKILVLKNQLYPCTHLSSFEQLCLTVLRVWLQSWELFYIQKAPRLGLP